MLEILRVEKVLHPGTCPGQLQCEIQINPSAESREDQELCLNADSLHLWIGGFFFIF